MAAKKFPFAFSVSAGEVERSSFYPETSCMKKAVAIGKHVLMPSTYQVR